MSDSLVLCFPPPLSLTFASLEALGLTIEFPVCLASKIFPIEYTNGIKSTYQHIRYLAMLLHGESYQLAIFLYIFEKKNCFKLLILIFIFIFMHGFVGKLRSTKNGRRSRSVNTTICLLQNSIYIFFFINDKSFLTSFYCSQVWTRKNATH